MGTNKHIQKSAQKRLQNKQVATGPTMQHPSILRGMTSAVMPIVVMTCDRNYVPRGKHDTDLRRPQARHRERAQTGLWLEE